MYHYTVRSWCLLRSAVRPVLWPPSVTLSHITIHPSSFTGSCSAVMLLFVSSLFRSHLACVPPLLLRDASSTVGSWQSKSWGRGLDRTEVCSGVLIKLAPFLGLGSIRRQAPGLGLISWQHASNWVRTMSGPWLWPYRDWITMSGDNSRDRVGEIEKESLVMEEGAQGVRSDRGV